MATGDARGTAGDGVDPTDGNGDGAREDGAAAEAGAATTATTDTTTATTATREPTVDGTTDVAEVPRPARWLVGVVLALLLVPGVIGFDLWPLTGWRLFSLSRDADQNRWVVQAVDGDGEVSTVSLEELPLGYRHAEWVMAELPRSSEARQVDVCRALAGAVADVRPEVVEVRLAKDAQELVEGDDGWELTHDPEVLVACDPEEVS